MTHGRRVLIVGCSLLAVAASIAATAPPLRPDPKLTPGAIMSPQPSLKRLCTPGYSATVRNVPESEKAAVFKEYGIDRHSTRFEVDHLISLELGGSNDIKNLWPQAYTTKPLNATVKDGLENRLHWLVCHAGLPPAMAQKAIAGDWTTAYKHYVVGNATR